MLGYIIKFIRQKKKLSLMDLKIKTGLSKSAISNIENDINNPTIDTLQKICDALEIKQSDLLELVNKFQHADEAEFELLEKNIDILIEENIINNRRCNIHANDNEIKSFDTAENAMKFLLEQPVIMGFGGFNVNKLSDKEMIEFANELLNQLRLLGYKYNK